MEMKKCTQCKKYFPATFEYFAKQKRVKSGLSSECKECRRAYEKMRRETKREELLVKSRGKYQRNKEIIKQKQKAYYSANKEKYKEYYQINKKKILESRTIYYKENIEKLRIASRMYLKTENGLENSRLRKHKRRALQRNLENSFTKKQWEECKVYFDNKCAYCGKEEKLSQDHFIPLTVGGEYTVNNIIPACFSCNASKNNNDFFTWYPNQSFYSVKRVNKILKYLNYNHKFQQLALL